MKEHLLEGKMVLDAEKIDKEGYIESRVSEHILELLHGMYHTELGERSRPKQIISGAMGGVAMFATLIAKRNLPLNKKVEHLLALRDDLHAIVDQIVQDTIRPDKASGGMVKRLWEMDLCDAVRQIQKERDAYEESFSAGRMH